MPESPDVVAVHPSNGRRWTSPGGHEDDGSITLYVVAVGDTAGYVTRRYEVTVPLEVNADGQLHVGEPQVAES